MELRKSKRRLVWNSLMGEEQIMKTKEEIDLGVIIQENLSPDKHISKIFELSYKMLTSMRVAFCYMDKDMMKKNHYKHDTPKAGICSSGMMVPELKDLTNEEQLKEMGLPTLQDRKECGDLITMYSGDLILKLNSSQMAI
ncbi:hypothetical protein E2C01_072166 [Portunus trituberculatus]|uniref:Uncharacterized protein n=1 Tax=Portunus trituberculatus TaxID=210409 RepID=A0A5B7IAD6_PORTR|nr:hypothetical protein [Portunus trituberculatus]